MLHKLDDNSSTNHSALVEASREGLALEFERSNSSRRLRLVLKELMRVMHKVLSEIWLFQPVISNMP